MDLHRLLALSSLLAITILARPVHAQTCQEILNKLPPASADSAQFSEPVNKYIEECKTRPGSEDPQVLDECIKAGLRALGVAGNYIAAIKMAKVECAAGNDTVSKTWLGLLLNNNHTSEQEKAVAQEAVDSNAQN